MRKQIQIDIQPGEVVRRFSQQEALDLADQWLQIFAANSGVSTKQFMWNVFSFDTYECVAKHKAREQYAIQVAPSYIVLTNDRQHALETNVRPTSCSASDFYVFPENFAWTMAFTHEDGWLGPFFARHAQYELLNQDNLYRIQKLRKVALAKANGWA